MPGDWSRHEPSAAAREVSAAAISAFARANWVWLVVGTLVVGCAVFVAHPWAEEPQALEWLYGGRSLPLEQADQIEAALRAAQISCTVEGGKIGVSGGRKAEAFALLAKSGLEPRSLDKLLDDEVNAGSIFDTSEQASRRRMRGFERAAEVVVRKVPGVAKAEVVFREVEAGTPLSPRRQLKATAFIDLDPGRNLTEAIEKKIRDIVISFGDVRPEDVTVMVPGAPPEIAGTGLVDGESHRRETELADRILQRLRIDGARVSVHIDSGASTAPHAAQQVVANRPINDGMPETQSAESGSEPSANRPAIATPAGRVTVLVSAPRSHFRRIYSREHPKQVPTLGEMEPIVGRVGNDIRSIVAELVPRGELADVRIELFDDIMPAVASGRETAKAEPHLAITSWAPIAGGIALAAVVLMVCTGWMASRKAPHELILAHHTHTRASRSHALEQAANTIRIDPAAAASVLRSWIREGGRSS